MKRYLRSGKLSKDYIFYTYWFTPVTTALLNLKDKFNLKVVTRAHGYDLYEEFRRNGYLPFRRRDAERIDKIITISMQGYDYLKKKYNLQNLFNSYLGINDLNIENPVNNTPLLKLVSCSLMSPVKRIDFIMEYLSKISTDLNVQIEWHHIGSGVLENNLKQKKDKLQHENFKIVFTGFLENKKIFDYYKHNPFDYFITLSESEGLPVSLMEACSVSLPIIATSVGGVNEIVKNEVNGFLLSPNLSYQEFKNTIVKAVDLKNNLEGFITFRKNSRMIYLNNFNAEINHKKFAQFLREL
jgi:glycosyltransferase involved in cell wall biosynthesis